MSWENALLLLDILKSHGVMQIDIMGGEPLLMEWMPGFIRTAVRHDFSVNMSTNGSRAGVLMEIKDIASSKFTVGISQASRRSRFRSARQDGRQCRNRGNFTADRGSHGGYRGQEVFPDPYGRPVEG
jgi:molybdenum cofactor biosynthesis enzyme MoaA